MKLTKNRKLICNILAPSTIPLSAQDIYDQIRDRGEEVWLSTIYRGLEALEKEDMVIKAQMPDSDQYHYIFCQEGHKHYAICLSCRKIIDKLSCPIHGYEKPLEDKGFEIVDHKFIIYGYCQDCLERRKNEGDNI